LTDAYRGLLSLELGNLDCQRQRLAQPIQDAVRVAANQGRRSALAEQISFLDSAEPSILEIEKNAEARRGAGVITGAELEEIRSLGTSLRISRLQATDTLAQLEATPLPDPTNRVSADADRYSKAAMDYERLDSRIRRVTPWGFSVTGGAASNVLESSSIRTVDWFGTVEMSYNFGGIPQVTAERAALEARQRELEASPTELLQSARALDASLERSLAALHAQIELLSESERSVREQIAVLEKAEVADQTHLISVLKLRSIALQSQLVYLRALVERRRAWEPTHEQ
jgi:hypothetical protein